MDALEEIRDETKWQARETLRTRFQEPWAHPFDRLRRQLDDQLGDRLIDQLYEDLRKE